MAIDFRLILFAVLRPRLFRLFGPSRLRIATIWESSETHFGGPKKRSTNCLKMSPTPRSRKAKIRPCIFPQKCAGEVSA